METNLVDGLGYDSVRNQYFTVTYAWKYIVPNQKKSKTTIGKSGITRYDVKTAMSEASPTRGRQFHQEALWGYECDRNYLPKNISQKDANKIVQTMDMLFKENMLDWTYREKKRSKEIGTEFYEGPVNEWLDRIKEEWANALSGAIMRVLGFDYDFDISMVQAMGNQGTVTEQIGEVLSESNKVRSIIPCGYGKSFIMWYGIHKWKQYKDKKFIIYYCHNIPATKQLAVKHSQYSNGGDGFKRVVVCSEKKYVNGQVKYGIENYSASESKLSEVLEESFKSPERVIFYVNNRSAGEFQEKFKSISKKLRLTISPGAVVDESQEFTGHKDTDKVDAIVRSISDYQVSFTATERRRGIDTNKDRIYNDDEKYFGVIANEITVSQTISEGRSCPITFKIAEVSDNHILMTEIQRNNIVETIFNDETTLSVRGRMLRSVVCLVKSIKEDERTHPMVVTSLIVNTHSFIRLITKLKELDIIPQDYEIVRGLRTDGINSAVEFNNHKKAIFVGTPWMVTGTDAPNTDGLIADYDMSSEITGSQWIGRGQRPVDDKELMVYIPTNPDDTEISTLLRVANKYIQDENVHIESGETNVEENNIDVLGSVQRRNIRTSIDRDINANPSLKVYWDKVYEDLTTNVIGRIGEYLQREYLPFEEAREHVRGLGLKNSHEYLQWEKTNRPENIPSNPRKIYGGNGWVDLGDYIGTFTKHWGNMEWRNFNDSRDYVRSLGLKSEKDDWRKITKEDWFPKDIPVAPWNVYDEYISMPDWLGTKPGYLGKNNYLPFEEAREYVRGLNLKNQSEYSKWSNSKDRLYSIPGNPKKIYDGKGWMGFSDWLGTKIGRKYGEYKTMDEVVEYIKSIGVKSNKEWRLIKKSEGFCLPVDIPSEPDNVFDNFSWTLVSGGIKRNKKNEHVSYEECKKYARGLNLKKGVEWKNMNHPIGIPKRPDLAYINNGFTNMMDFLGIKKEITKEDILSVQKDNTNIGVMAKLLGISYNKFVKLSKEYGIHKVCDYSDRAKRICAVRKSHGVSKGHKDHLIMPIEDAKKIVRKFKFKNNKEYKKYHREGKLDKTIPLAADQTYIRMGVWKGWTDFLGKVNKHNYETNI